MQHQDRKLEFTGQHIYVGIDVSKRSWSVSILVGEYYHKKFTQPPQADVLLNYLRRNFPGAEYHCVYEAGYCGFWIYEALTQGGIQCLVVNPADVPTSHKEKIHKTDPVDAR